MEQDKKESTEDDNRGNSESSNQQGDTGLSRTRINKAQEIVLDQWQQEVREYDGNIALRAGRQVGKSTVIAIKAAEYAIQNPKKSIMIISATERQAYLLFLKVLNFLSDNYKKLIRTGRDQKTKQTMSPTKTAINLTNKSVIRCLPTGMDGLGIRGYTVDLLIADEAAFINQDVWQAVTPMLATTGGKIILLSTPFGRQGYFFDRFQDKNFKKWHINAEDVAEDRQEPQRTNIKDYHEQEKLSMSTLQYAQEFLGEFVDEMRQLYPNELVKRLCTIQRGHRTIAPSREYYLGVDIARMGEDSSSFQIVERINKDSFQHVESIMTSKTKTTDTFEKIIELEKLYNFKKIGIDAGSGSLGVGLLDFLLKVPIIRNKIEPLNNKSRMLDRYGERKATLLGVDMYLNLKSMMEMGVINLLKDDDVINSLRAIQFEYSKTSGGRTTPRIFASRHKDTDLVEGLMRAAFLANQKNINTSISYI